MKKVSYLECLGLIVLLFIFSCSKNDDKTVTANPINFNVSVEDVTFNSALLTWETAETPSTGSVTYTVKVGDSIYEEETTSLQYFLDSLEHTTPYNVTIIASNSEGETIAQTNFVTQTPDNIIFLLESFDNGKDFYADKVKAVLFYDEQMRLEYLDGDDNSFTVSNERNYNENEFLRSEILSQDIWEEVFESVRYFYLENRFDSIVHTAGDIFGFTRYYYKFYNETNYNQLYIQYPEYDTIHNNDFSLKLNNNNQVTYIEKMDLINNTTQEAFFEYEEKNLTKVINYEGDVYEITYDDKNNFQTYPGTYGYFTFRHTVSVLTGFDFMTEYSDEKFGTIPYLNELQTTNNPVELKKNGVVYRTNQFTYNSFGYPIQMITETDTITFTYKEIY